MGSGFQFFDIILLAMIAGFLILRLRRVLGRRDGHEGGYPDPFRPDPDAKREPADDADENVVRLPDRSGDAPQADAAPIGDGDSMAAALTRIKIADPSFDPDQFASGARVAFEMILNAFSGGDRKTLKGLLSPDVYANFEAAISKRERANEVLEDTLVGIRSAAIVDAGIDGRMASVTIKFISEQVNVLRDATGKVIEGDPNRVVDVTDYWTFARDIRSSDPNWTLVATESNN
ncbi:MAG: Tim44/TimA family putative adaptor protein [Proteobacteria bacterium]|nr:Tim44/TimA family putative adaptor protein [Pseudomonadota bacterium]